MDNSQTISLKGIYSAMEKGMFELALSQCQNILNEHPNLSEVYVIRGDCEQRLGDIDSAIVSYKKAHAIKPDYLRALQCLAKVAQEQGKLQDEIQYALSIFKLDTSQSGIFSRLIELLLKLEDYEAALKLLKQYQAELGFSLTPSLAIDYIRCLHKCGDNTQAFKLVFQQLKLNHFHPELIQLSIVIAEVLDELEQLLECFLAYLQDNLSNTQLTIAIGHIYFKLDKYDLAEQYLMMGLESSSDDANAWHELAMIQRQLGHSKAAQQSLEQCLTIDPYNSSALRVFGHEQTYQYGDVASRRLFKAAARMDEYQDIAQSQLHYALAKFFEDVNDLEIAFEHYKKGGQIRKRIDPWSDLRMRNVLMTMKQYLQAQDFQQAATLGCRSNKPVFVFGMPRSGTSLLEQVISSHPQAYGAGELKTAAAVINNIKTGRVSLETQIDGYSKLADQLQGCTHKQRGEAYIAHIEALAEADTIVNREIANGADAKQQDYARIVDKMPGNYHWVGLLSSILPNAYFIHSRRHPVEICLSQYRIFFPDGINFSYDLRDLGKAYRLYHDYMQYWHEVLPKGRILDVRYEHMVHDIDSQARRILNHIELAWDESCLKFYETKRKVKTASVSQVRQPIYTSSTNRWHKYKPYLKPLLDELGPLVKDYEDELIASGLDVAV